MDAQLASGVSDETSPTRRESPVQFKQTLVIAFVRRTDGLQYSPRTGLSRPITCSGHSVTGRRFRLRQMFASIRDQRPLQLRKPRASILPNGGPFVPSLP